MDGVEAWWQGGASVVQTWAVACFVFTVPLVFVDLTVGGVDAWGDLDVSLDEELEHEALHHWCEAVHETRFVRTPANAYSALSFCYLGLLVLVIALTYNATCAENHLRYFVAFDWFVGLAMLFAGLCSFLNHASVNGGWTRTLDRVSIWPLVSIPTFLCTLRFFEVPATQCVYVSILSVLLGLLILASVPHLIENGVATSDVVKHYLNYGVPAIAFLFPVLLVVRRILESQCVYHHSSLTFGLPTLSVVLSILGMVLQDPELLNVCDPNGPWFLNTHLWWHVLQSISVFLVWFSCYFEDRIDKAYQAVLAASRAKRKPRLRLFPSLSELWNLQPARSRV
tara:strand:- start:4357 stop:5373 length:1017 start_codon:yes stop_codon:yes gene_type:complete